MKLIHYDDPEKDIIQITRKEFMDKCHKFIEDNSFIRKMKESGNNEGVLLEQVKNIILMYEYEEMMFGEESNEKTSTCNDCH